MRSKISLFNKAIIKNDVRRFWWVSALYAVILFFIVPFQYMTMDKEQFYINWTQNPLPGYIKLIQVIQAGDQVQILFMLVFPVLLGALLFRYMQTAKSTSVTHSLPVNRKVLFLSHNLVGILMLACPVILNMIILRITGFTSDLEGFCTISDLLQWAGITLLFEFVFFASVVFTGMFTGNSIAQIVFTYILNILPVGIYMLLTYNFSVLLHGYSRHYNFPEKYLPVTILASPHRMSTYITASSVTVIIVVAAVLFIAAYFAYRNRELEAAGDIVSFSYFRPVFKYGVTICCALLCGIYFAGIYKRSVPLALLGYVLGSLAGYIIAELLLQKSFKIWRAYKGYLIYALIMAAVLLGIKLDFTGYVHRLPKLDDVQRVDIDNYYFKNPENIKSILNIHKLLTDRPDFGNGRYFHLLYTMKNGKTMIREYSVDQKLYDSLLKPVYETMEYKREAFPVITQKAADIKAIEISDGRIEKRPVVLGDEDKIQEFIDALSKDIKSLTYEDMNKTFYINVLVRGIDKRLYSCPISDSFPVSYKWLKDKDYYNKISVNENDISKVVAKRIALNKTRYGEYSGNPTVIKQIEINDKETIKKLLSTYSQDRGSKIEVDFYNKESQGYPRFIGYLNPDTPVSGKLAEYIKQLES